MAPKAREKECARDIKVEVRKEQQSPPLVQHVCGAALAVRTHTQHEDVLRGFQSAEAPTRRALQASVCLFAFWSKAAQQAEQAVACGMARQRHRVGT